MLRAIPCRQLRIMGFAYDLDTILDLLFNSLVGQKFDRPFDVMSLRLITLNQRALEMTLLNVVEVSVHQMDTLLACCSLTAKQENGLSGREIEEFLTFRAGKAGGRVHLLVLLVYYSIFL